MPSGSTLDGVKGFILLSVPTEKKQSKRDFFHNLPNPDV